MITEKGALVYRKDLLWMMLHCVFDSVQSHGGAPEIGKVSEGKLSIYR